MKKTVLAAIGFAVTLAICPGASWAGHENDSNTWYGLNAGNNNGNDPSLTAVETAFFGHNAGRSTTSGNSNVFIGPYAGEYNTSGNSNVCVGDSAGNGIITGESNTFIGDSTGLINTGSFNTFIGADAGGGNTTGSNNVFIGYSAGYNEAGSNKLYISNSDTASPLIGGDFNAQTVTINGTLIMAASASLSDERVKKNIEPLKASLNKVINLQGISYEWKSEEYPGSGFGKSRQIGFIAQDVEALLPELVFTNSNGYKSLAYDKLVPVLVEAIKEQDAIMKEKDARIEKLEKALEKIERRMATIESPEKTFAMK